ncbi:MAG: 4Fe-4S binding protein [Clostridiales bacterium]|nr:4Fe-4S binding protein [Clostridiales bacterium]MCF8022042.1 4Fe-4S binding protein [Clostridiales bacterium]
MYVIDTASWRNFYPVIDKEKCINCGFCYDYCPVNSVYKKDEEFYIDLKYCKGCGICAQECPKNAIDMVLEGGSK